MSREEIVNNIGYQLTRAAVDYIEKHEFADGMDCFEAGAEWMQKKMIDKACEWLKEYMYVEHIFEYSEDDEPVHYVCASTCNSVDEFINKFKKAIEE